MKNISYCRSTGNLSLVNLQNITGSPAVNLSCLHYQIIFFQVHRMNCVYQTIPCNNEGCNVEYLKGEFIQHDKECLFKLLQCEYCQDEVLRMDKNKHLVGCLNEHVDCVYLDIGCQIKISRSSVIEHEYEHQSEHMRLLYQNFTHCKKELSISNNENATLKKKIEDLEIKSNEEISYLKQEVKSIRTEFEEFKKESVRSIEEIKTTESEKENVALTTKVKTKDNKEEIETSGYKRYQDSRHSSPSPNNNQKKSNDWWSKQGEQLNTNEWWDTQPKLGKWHAGRRFENNDKGKRDDWWDK